VARPACVNARWSALGQPFPYPETGSTEVRHTPFLTQVDGGALGVGAGSTIRGYEIARIGHGVLMRWVSYPHPASIMVGLGVGLSDASAVIQRKKYRVDTARSAVCAVEILPRRPAACRRRRLPNDS
jgi:hypothetical protein